ncbi:unnamed protein product [Symbiodinium natans]|uniref:Uncharacterized protein n=1 Tax=Symbiodinium natans TaxID=878477 RepID=A0A812NC64_9DINO|nr:unnamed protein product [Symbiodinium natans]
MVRFGARVALSASFLVAAGFVGFVPVSPPRCHKSLMPASVAEATAPEARRDVPTGVPVVMAVLAGLVVAFAMPPKALAQPGGLPDFSVVRPGYMQGIDAANAATKPGEIDFVTRSRIEAAQFPQAVKELQKEKATIEKNAPTKEERLQRYRQQAQAYSQSASIE